MYPVLLFSGTILLLLMAGRMSASIMAFANESELPKVNEQICDSIVEKGKTHTPVAMMFLSACLIFAPHVYKSIGGTLYHNTESVAPVEGLK